MTDMTPFFAHTLSRTTPWLTALIGAGALCVSLAAGAHGPYPTVHPKDIPEDLRANWSGLQSEMTENSHCAAAFDSHTDGEKMVFKCSIHIKMAHEGARRAMRYCEEAREQHRIKGPCRLIEK